MISISSAARWATVLASTLALGAPPAPPAPPTPPLVVDVLAMNGSGCRPGSVFVVIPPDNTGFDLAYDTFMASTDGVVEFRKSCQVTLQVHPPEGMTYALTRTDFRGFAHLEPDVTARLRTRHNFAGTAPGPFSAHPFTGPMDDDWQVTEVIEPADQVVAPCGEQPALTVWSELTVVDGTAAGQTSWITLQALSWPAFSTFHLTWSECPAP